VRPDGSTRLTDAREFLGTPAYAAPEQVRGGALDARTDVYALGGLLYACLTGRAPYAGEEPVMVFQSHLFEPPPRPRAANPAVSGAFDRVVMRAMAKNPGDRFASAGDVGRAAVAALEGAPLPRASAAVATGDAAFDRRTWRRRRPAMGAAGVALAVAGAATILGLAPGGRSAPAHRDASTAPVFRLATAPEAIAVAGDRMWSVQTQDGHMERMDLHAHRVASFPGAVDLGGGPFPAIALGPGAVWVAHATASGGVDRVDPASGAAVQHVPLAWSYDLSPAAGRIWVLTQPASDAGGSHRSSVVQIDTRSNRIDGRRVVLPHTAAAIAATSDAVWVADGRSAVLRVDPRAARVVARIEIGRRPTAIVADERSVWVLDAGDRTVARIDPRANEPEGAPVSLGKELEDIAIGARGLWVAASDGTVTLLDPIEGRQRFGPVPAGRPPLRLAATADRAGVAAASATDQTVRWISG
jgi:streptogramin lyase